MRFVENITTVKLGKLKNIFKNGDNARTRARAHAVILSNKGFTIDSIANIFDVDRDSVSSWLNRWQTCGIEGLSDLPKDGRPPILFDDLKKK